MSDCREITKLIVQQRSGILSEKELNQLEEHVSSCAECAQKQKVLAKGFGALNNISKNDFAPADSFKQSLHLKLAEANQLRHQTAQKKQPLFFRFKLAAFLTAIFIVVGTLFFFVQHKNSGVIDTYYSEASVDKPVMIELFYDADGEKNGVQFSIKLGDGLVFDSQDQQIASLRSHSWSNSLKEGSNRVPFAVKILRAGQFEIETVARHSGLEYPYRIILKTDGAIVKITYIRMKPKKADYAS